MSIFRRTAYHLRSITTATSTSLSRRLSTINDRHHPPPEIPTSAYFDAQVNSAAQAGDFNLLRRLLTDRISEGCFNTNNTFKFLTTTPTSLSLLHPLFESLSHLPKGLPRKNAFDSLIARLCKLRLPDLALQLFDKMRQRNLEFSTVTFHPILNALARQREIQQCQTLLRLMTDAGAPPDTTAYNFLLTAICADGNKVAAAELLTEMRDKALAVDARTYDAMVLGACRAGRVDGAVAVMRAALEDGVPLLYSTPVHVVTALMEGGYYAQAVKLVVGEDDGRDWEMGSECFEVLASRLVKMERFKEAKIVLGEMKKKGFRMGEKLREFYQWHT